MSSTREVVSSSPAMSIESGFSEGHSEVDSSVYDSPPPYLPDQRVLCKDKHNEQHFYQAIVRKVKCASANEWSFFIHYQGWNSRWDRWVFKEDLVVDTPENRNNYLRPTEPKKRKATTSGENSSFSAPGNVRKRRATTDGSTKVMDYQAFCELPFTLKNILVDEAGYVTRKGFDSPCAYDCELSTRPARSVHILPAAVTVKQVLQHYQRKRGGIKEDETKQYQVRRFCQGLGSLFDDALPVCLLYPEERPQYESLQRDQELKDKKPCEIYGCEFLLRFMMRLPVLLQAETKCEMDVMGPLIADLIVLLQKNRQACFKTSYREPKYCEYLDWEKSLAGDDQAGPRSLVNKS